MTRMLNNISNMHELKPIPKEKRENEEKERQGYT